MPHYPQLLANVPQGVEPRQGDCRDQEDAGFLNEEFSFGLCFCKITLDVCKLIRKPIQLVIVRNIYYSIDWQTESITLEDLPHVRLNLQCGLESITKTNMIRNSYR